LEVKYWKFRRVGYVLLECIQDVGKTKKKKWRRHLGGGEGRLRRDLGEMTMTTMMILMTILAVMVLVMKLKGA
jgi:hypothetical protein